MTVKELIEQLSKEDGDMTVIMKDRQMGACCVHTVECVDWPIPKDAKNPFVLLM